MAVLNIPLVAFFTVLTVLVLAAALRQLMGLTLSPLRILIAALIAFFAAPPIITAMAGAAVTSKHPGVLPGLWFILLGVVIAMLVGMLFLVISEALVPSGSLPGPLYVLRGTRQLARRTRRYSQVGRILARHGLIPYLRGGRRSELATPEGRVRLARSLRLALEDGGVTFIKLGQVLSTRRDLLPPEFIAELSRLQDDAPTVPWPDISEVLESSLGGPVTEKFAGFDTEPIAAASIAQVHAASLPSGDRVVVKVRRPDVTGVVGSDLDIVQRLAVRLQHRTRWGRSVGAVDLAQGFAAALREELDLRIEAQNMTAAAAAARHDDLRVPAAYQPYCGERVLVMQYLHGRPLLTAAPGLPAGSRTALARDLLDSLLRQVMLGGIFHADPHPGNILLLDDGHLGLLDWGSVGRIDAGLRGALQRLLLALDHGDPVLLNDALLNVVDRPEQLDEPRLERALGRFLARYFAAGTTPDMRMFTDLFRIVADYGLAIPPEIAAVFRALATMEGTLTQLDPGFNIAAESRRFGEQQLAAQLSPEAIRNTAGTDLAMLVPMLRRLPRRIDRLGGALEDGRLTVSVRLLADPSDRRYLTGLVHRVLLAFLAAAAGIMAVLMIGLRGGPALSKTVSLYTFFGYCLLVIAAILAVRVLVQVFRPEPG
ncbi:MAG: AarF/ABC1/UbiB kinase family protein [Actinobacteria bacterium]|nr:AarF/ABC1/UbiB kinase family protein [Actinomycetota bacterium]